jgi:hypothetical protein
MYMSNVVNDILSYPNDILSYPARMIHGDLEGSSKRINKRLVLYKHEILSAGAQTPHTMVLMTLKIAPNSLRRRPYRRLKTMIKTTKNFSYIFELIVHICITWVGAPLRSAQNIC